MLVLFVVVWCCLLLFVVVCVVVDACRCRCGLRVVIHCCFWLLLFVVCCLLISLDVYFALYVVVCWLLFDVV